MIGEKGGKRYKGKRGRGGEKEGGSREGGRVATGEQVFRENGSWWLKKT